MSKQTNDGKPPDKIELKTIKHVFTPAEAAQLHTDLLNALGNRDTVEAEFDNVKATWKAKVEEAEARITRIAATLRAGFDLRDKRCRVVYRPEARQKDYLPESGNDEVLLTEDMTTADFQAELLHAESGFDKREEIPLFPMTGHDKGALVVGRLGERWFTALRITIGKFTVDERLDSLQRSYKHRPDAVKATAKRAMEWLKENLRERSDGFKDSIDEVVNAHRERAE